MTEIVPPFALRAQDPIPTIDDCAIEMLSDGGGYRISWQMPTGLHGRRAQVFARKVTSKSSPYAIKPKRAEPYFLGTGYGHIDVAGLSQDIEIYIVPELGEEGVFPGPQHATPIRCTTPEFRRIGGLSDVSGFAVERDGSGFVMQWAPVASPELTHYEVRRGTRWEGAKVIARTKDTQIRYAYPTTGSHDFMVRAFFGPGMPSPRVTQSLGNEWISAGTGHRSTSSGDLYIVIDEHPLMSSATLSDLTLDGSTIKISDGKHSGTATFSTSNTLAYNVLRWALDWDVYQTEPGEVWGDGCNRWRDVIMGSPEAQFATYSERRPSWRRPGVNLDVGAAELDEIGFCNFVWGRGTTVGHHTRCKVDIRYHNSQSTFTSWKPFEPGCTLGDGAEVRFTLERGSLRQQLNLEGVAITAFAPAN